MERHDAPGGVFLRPMRIMSSSQSCEIDINGGDFELQKRWGLAGNWFTRDLVRVHWELIINIKRKTGGPLLWVEPLIVEHQEIEVVNEELEISDGRTESDAL